ncbi:MAG: stage II sporulation protein P [Firmicutes bacterium]|nr:stage II sporulation protein P [Bacillota bacterium]
MVVLGAALPLGPLVARGDVLERFFGPAAGRVLLRQAMPVLGLGGVGGGPGSSTGGSGAGGGPSGPGDGPGSGEAEGASPSAARGPVAWVIRLLTGVSLGEPVSFLRADLPLARSPYAEAILAAGRGPAPGSGGGSGGTAPGAGEGTGGGTSGGSAGQPGSGSGGSTGPGSGDTGTPGGPPSAETGVPPEVTEDPDAQLRLYGKGSPVIALVHTHTSESYLPAVEALAKARDPRADTSRLEAFTTDRTANMLRVGEELARYLSAVHGLTVVQSQRAHDAREDGFRLGAYERSLETMTAILRRYPSVRLLLDIHRDAPGRETTTTYIGGVPTANICIIVGTDKLLPNAHWKANYELARRLVRAMEETYPGLSRGILVRDERYNQHVMAGTLLIEIGGQENTLEEVFAAVRCLGDVLAKLVAEGL